NPPVPLRRHASPAEPAKRDAAVPWRLRSVARCTRSRRGSLGQMAHAENVVPWYVRGIGTLPGAPFYSWFAVRGGRPLPDAGFAQASRLGCATFGPPEAPHRDQEGRMTRRRKNGKVDEAERAPDVTAREHYEMLAAEADAHLDWLESQRPL